jgi:PAS domain-containing protein
VPLAAAVREALAGETAPLRRADLVFVLGAAAAREPEQRAPSLELLRPAAAAPEFEVVARSIAALGRIGDDVAVAELSRIRAHSTDAVVRYLATRELASAKAAAALGAVRAALDDGDPRVRETAALALGHRRDGSSAGRLVAAAKQEPWPFVRRAQVTALGAMCEAGDLLVRADERDVPEVRREALAGLARCRDGRAPGLLLRALGRRAEDPEIRALAARLLATLKDQRLDSALRRGAGPAADRGPGRSGPRGRYRGGDAITGTDGGPGGGRGSRAASAGRTPPVPSHRPGGAGAAVRRGARGPGGVGRPARRGSVGRGGGQRSATSLPEQDRYRAARAVISTPRPVIIEGQPMAGQDTARTGDEASERRFATLMRLAADVVTLHHEDGPRLLRRPLADPRPRPCPRGLAGPAPVRAHPRGGPARGRAAAGGHAGGPGGAPARQLPDAPQGGRLALDGGDGHQPAPRSDVGGLVFNQHDVTDRRATEEALRQSEQRFRAWWRTPRTASSWPPPAGTLMYVSPSTERLYDRPGRRDRWAQRLRAGTTRTTASG